LTIKRKATNRCFINTKIIIVGNLDREDLLHKNYETLALSCLPIYECMNIPS